MTDGNNIVSIIIPYYNLKNFIEETVSSCITQTYPHIEIIVINDGSNFENSQFLNKIKVKFGNKISIVKQTNQGLSSARNNGFKSSHGKYVCFLDADDKLEPSFIEKAVTLLEKNKSINVATSYLKRFGARFEILNTPPYDPVKILALGGIPLSSVMTRSLFEKVKGFSTYMNSGYEDWEFWVKALSHGLKWEVIEEPLILYRARKQSMVASSNKKRTSIINQIISHNEDIYLKHYKDIILELIAYNDRIISTKGWKLLDAIRSIKNRFCQ